MNTREKLIRIAHANPELRVKLLPLIKKHGSGTEEDISQNILAFKTAYESFKTAIQDAKDRGISGDSRIARQWANKPWVKCMELGFKIAEGVIGTRSIPPRNAKGIEMAYRLYYRSRTMPKDVYKWWDKNEKRLLLTIEAAERWKPNQQGTDDLFTVGPFTVHNTIGAQGKALDAFKKALEVDPNDPAIRYNLGCFYARAGDPDKAFECLEGSITSSTWIENDADLDSLREDPRYRRLLERLEER